MKYNQEIGKIYDTIFFLIEYFNYKEIENGCINIYDNTGFMIDCYQQVLSEVGDVSDYLAPLFYSKDGIPSSMSIFFSENIDFQKDNIDSFIVKIITQAEFLYKKTYQYIFGESENITTASYIDSIKKFDAPVEFKLKLAICFGNFTYAVSEAAALLKRVYLIVDKLYQKYEKELLNRFNQIKSDSNLQLYKNTIKYDPKEYKNTEVSICLINQFIVYQLCHSFNDIYFILGYHHEESLSEYITNYITDFDTTSEQFIITCGNDIRLKMIAAIAQHGELTSSQIAQILKYPVTTTIRHINMLSSYGLIYIARREGNQIFYKLNIMLFKKMRVEINEKFDNIINQNRSN